MHRFGWWILVAALFLAAQAGWRSAAPEFGTATALDGGGGQPQPTKRP
jgi:hypothetical protein